MRNGICSAVLLSATLAQAQPMPTMYWPLDEPGGSIAHDIVGDHDGLVHGNATWLPTGGHHGGALRCYGNTAGVDLGPCDVITGTGDRLTVACWFKPEVVSGTERVLIAKALGPDGSDVIWSLSLVNSTGARFRVRAGGLTYTVEAPPGNVYSNTWYHMAGTYDGHGTYLYINASLVASGTAEGTIGHHPEAPATLGNRYDNAMPFYGSLDDVRIYDDALDASDVIDLVIGDVHTAMEENAGIVRTDGKLLVPPGFSSLRLIDSSGRPVADQRLDGLVPVLPPLASGWYLVLLESRDGRRARRRVWL